MNRMILFAALLACAFAKPGYLASPYYGYGAGPYGYAAAPYHYGYAGPYNHGYAAPHAYNAVHPGYAPSYASQYHSQDELGSAAYGYTQYDQTHNAVRDYTGAVRGSYSYIDAEGKKVFTDYIADHNGFRVVSNNLPVGPKNDLVAPVFNLEAPVFDLVGPAPVEDTPEVKAAREEHLAAVAEAKASHGERKKRDVVAAHHAAFPYAYGFPHTYGAFPYARHGAFSYAHGYAAAPYAYAAPYAHAYATPYAHAYATPYAHAVGREATLTKTILNPGHAEAYRVD